MSSITSEVSLREKVAYGCGDLSSNLMWGMTSSYLMFYYTDIYGLSVVAVGWILLVARVFDAFCDPAIGYVIDRQGGQIVPRLIRSLALPFGVAGCVCFVSLPLSPNGKILWALLTYIALGAIYSCINTPYGALGTMITRQAHDRVGLNAFRMMGCQGGQFIVSLFTIPAITWLGGGSSMVQRQHGMALYALCLATAATILWRYVGRVCITRYPPPPARHSPVVLLRTLAQNRCWWLCNGLVFLQFAGLAALYGFALYYARIILGGTDEMGGVLLTTATIMGFAGAIICPHIVHRLGVIGSAAVCGGVQVMAYLLLVLAGGCVPFSFAAFAILTLAQGITSPLYYVLLAHGIDVGRMASPVNTAGMAYSINTLVTKLSMGVTGFVLATFLAHGHYAGDVHTFSPALKHWIMAGFVWLPLGAAALQLVLLAMWPRGVASPVTELNP
ncbi:MFS transporter [Komagataeibacter intermedius]|uniref:Sugar transporter n=2 Tax=Komagataeibacter intermedius TaxID=66229 RepID=A0A0N0ME83_9PROT|nr:MFS transporter [Komagataeibacter intermedius]KPH86186.1 sugar transporter [Komagataeibacter intermedius AF2]MCF3637285.1 MFS transporter [Komagataeibacter intermedius]GAN87767.1 major facilitator superfamily sugar transporter [Komagataeibacter intermedius TF2]GBQ70291.1 sugar transporter [Komagataeibacter intermedius NRIC 0521]